MVELLAPVGSPESVEAAVQGGANAVYLGYGDFNARRNAKNFTLEQLEQAVDYCHLRDVSVFLTLNTLLTQKELSSGGKLIGDIAKIGVDAVIVQDLGVAKMVQTVAPSLELHASTQMSIHSLDGVKKLEQFGFSRVVLARELGRSELEYISAHSPLDLEVFVHGAQCMSYSGQCYFSAMVGQRSGNRGLCAQPCRLEYHWGDATGCPSSGTLPQKQCFSEKPKEKTQEKKSPRRKDLGRKTGTAPPKGCGSKNSHPMSLKDMSLAYHLGDLAEMGIKSFKVEGRMKRPEYVYTVSKIYSNLLKEGRLPSVEEENALKIAFSRDGFTQGYYQEDIGPKMFGVRTAPLDEGKEERSLFSQARQGYENQENRKIPITCDVVLGESTLELTLTDPQGHGVTGRLNGVESARNKALTKESILEQLRRTGGTPFEMMEGNFSLTPDRAMALSQLNQLRRNLLDDLSKVRVTGYKRETIFPFPSYHTPPRPNYHKPVFTVWVQDPRQITVDLLQKKPALLYLPFHTPDSVVALCQSHEIPLALQLPAIASDEERQQYKAQAEKFLSLGVKEALVGTVDCLAYGQSLGFSLRGDYGLNIYNDLTLSQWKDSLTSATPSFELKFSQIRDLMKEIPLEIFLYGHLPLMTTKNCMIGNAFSQEKKKKCLDQVCLTDRKGEQFPVEPSIGGRNTLYNGRPLYLADKKDDWSTLGLWGGRLCFTRESPDTVVEVYQQYESGSTSLPSAFTRGLYYRGVT